MIVIRHGINKVLIREPEYRELLSVYMIGDSFIVFDYSSGAFQFKLEEPKFEVHKKRFSRTAFISIKARGFRAEIYFDDPDIAYSYFEHLISS